MANRLVPQRAPADPGGIARRLLRSVAMASLATLDDAGWPYASLVAMAVDHDGTPLLLLSQLSDHTQNLARSDRASLLLDATEGIGNRMAGERLTLMGPVAPLPADRRDAARGRYLARHPAAAPYEGFGDFGYYRMTVARAHLIGGFAKAHWLDADAFMPRLPDGYTLPAAEPGIIAHMNADHAAAVALYATKLARRKGQGWRLTGIDAEGVDLRRGAEVARVAFDQPVRDAAAAKDALMALVQRARAAEAHG